MELILPFNKDDEVGALSSEVESRRFSVGVWREEVFSSSFGARRISVGVCAWLGMVCGVPGERVVCISD